MFDHNHSIHVYFLTIFVQNASRVFQLLKESVYAQLHQVPTPDMAVETLNALYTTMLARGQDCIWRKTEQGLTKVPLLGALNNHNNFSLEKAVT